MDAKMTTSEPEKTPSGYPIQFTTPLLLKECANRIRQSFDQRMGMSFATMQGQLEKINDTTYTFSLYQDLKNQRVIISGRFITETASSTLIEASFKREFSLSVWVAGIPLILMMIVSCFAASVAWGLVTVTIIAALSGLYLYAKRKAKSSPPRKPKYAPASELLWYFERTLKE